MSKYSEKFLDPRWQKKRLKILERDDWRCQSCGDKNVTLNVHHIFYKKGKDPWDYNDNILITWCEDCHKKRHTMQHQVLKYISKLTIDELTYLMPILKDRELVKSIGEINTDRETFTSLIDSIVVIEQSAYMNGMVAGENR